MLTRRASETERELQVDAPRAFVLEEPSLAIGAPAEARERSVRADHPVTGHDDADGIAAVRAADGAHRADVAHATREIEVADRLPEADVAQRAPHASLEGRAVGRER